jgi:hypothetical protein
MIKAKDLAKKAQEAGVDTTQTADVSKRGQQLIAAGADTFKPA